MNQALAFKWISSSGDILVLSMHMLETIMVDDGGRAAAVTVHRVVGKVTGKTCRIPCEINGSNTMGNQKLSERIQKELFEIKGFDVVLLPKVFDLTLILLTRPGKPDCLEKTLDTIKQAAIQVAQKTSDTVTTQKKTSMNALQFTMTLYKIRAFSPWQLLLEKTLSDKSNCENPDPAQCSVEVVNEAAKQRLRVKEESYKAYFEEELSLRKRGKEIHQAQPWWQWAASEWC